MLNVDATVGGAAADSYETVDEADDYFLTRIPLVPPWPNSTRASAVIGSGADNMITAVFKEAGEIGNDYELQIVLAVGINQPMTAALVDQTLVVTLGTDGTGTSDPTKNTGTLVVTAITDVEASPGVTLVDADVSGDGTGIIEVGAVDFTGGTGEATKVPLLVTATRLLDVAFQGRRTFVPNGPESYFRVGRKWTGAPATPTQVRAWPRIGMYDRNGNPIASDVIPQELKDAESEFAGQLLKGDRSLDNDVIVQGLTSVRAGSVALTFKDTIFPQVLPDAVLALLPDSWFTDERYESSQSALFDVVSVVPQGDSW